MDAPHPAELPPAVPRAAAPPAAEPAYVETHPRAVRWMHWINFPMLTVMTWSGLLIYWAHDPYRIGWGDWTLLHFFPDAFYEALGLKQKLARGMAFHFVFGWLFTLNGLAYVVYTAASGEWRHLVPARRDWRDAAGVVLHDLRIRKAAPPQGKYNAAQKITYTGVIAMGAGMVLTGFAIYKPTQLAWLTALFGGYEGARMVHFILTMLFVVFFVVHIVQVAREGWRALLSMVTGYQRADTLASAHGPADRTGPAGPGDARPDAAPSPADPRDDA